MTRQALSFKDRINLETYVENQIDQINQKLAVDPGHIKMTYQRYRLSGNRFGYQFTIFNTIQHISTDTYYSGDLALDPLETAKQQILNITKRCLEDI